MTQPHPDGVPAELARLLRPHWPVLLGSIAAGMVGGAAVTALLATINDSLHLEGGGTAYAVLLTFAGLCAVSVVGKIVSDIGTNYVGQHVVARLREELSRKILLAPIDQIEPGKPDDVKALAGKGGAVDKAAFKPAIEDFYMTNPIARASAVMAECSRLAAGQMLTAAE